VKGEHHPGHKKNPIDDINNINSVLLVIKGGKIYKNHD
jgi:hypothetical protein